jgi:regulator of replication initiation timing
MELLAIIAENEYLRIENEKFKALLTGTHCPHLTQKGLPCKNSGLCKVHGVSGMLRK